MYLFRWGLSVLAVLVVAACSPPPPAIKQCQAQASAQARGHALDSTDVGELVEACMLNKGWALDENSAQCTDDYKTAVTPQCYYRDDFFGRALRHATVN
jgi:hypothetical protein